MQTALKDYSTLSNEVSPAHYPPGMGEESRLLHRKYKELLLARRYGADNSAEFVQLTDECSAKGIVLVPGGENL